MVRSQGVPILRVNTGNKIKENETEVMINDVD